MLSPVSFATCWIVSPVSIRQVYILECTPGQGVAGNPQILYLYIRSLYNSSLSIQIVTGPVLATWIIRSKISVLVMVLRLLTCTNGLHKGLQAPPSIRERYLRQLH